MALQGRVSQAPAGVIGFDSSDALTAVTARQYFNRGFRFCVRYVSHDEAVPSSYRNLTADEGQAIIDAGLALFVIQHPLAAGWVPTARLGQQYGQNAAIYAGNAGVPPGVNVFLDLEGVKPGTPDGDVIDYCNAWFAEIEAVGYVSGVYVAAAPGLSADELYWNLKTKHYWRGGSSVEAGVPADIPNRGYQLSQRIQNPGQSNEFDWDVTKTDNFGSGVMWISNASLVA